MGIPALGPEQNHFGGFPSKSEGEVRNILLKALALLLKALQYIAKSIASIGTSGSHIGTTPLQVLLCIMSINR